MQYMQKIINEILKANNIAPKEIVKHHSFNNLGYSINDKYILRIRNKASKTKFNKSIFLLKLFNAKKVKVPKLLNYGTINKQDYILYKKIDGERLYSLWHKLTVKEKENIIKNICEQLKKINKIQYNKEFKKYRIFKPTNWKNKIIYLITRNLNYLLNHKILNKTEFNKLNNFCKKNYFVLGKENSFLSYIDLHWGNIIIKNKKFQGLLDFDDINFYPLDYALTTINKLAYYPKLFASEKEEKLIKAKDYAKILVWFKKYYP